MTRNRTLVRILSSERCQGLLKPILVYQDLFGLASRGVCVKQLQEQRGAVGGSIGACFLYGLFEHRRVATLTAVQQQEPVKSEPS